MGGRGAVVNCVVISSIPHCVSMILSFTALFALCTISSLVSLYSKGHKIESMTHWATVLLPQEDT
jgi:hypothetical protein